VGSLYQYYPNRDALLAAVLEKHLLEVAGAVERTCEQCRGKPVSDMAAELVSAFLAVKLRNPAMSKALYAIAAERGGAELVVRINTRIVAAIAAMLATSSDAQFEAPVLIATVVLSALVGPVRTLLEGCAPPLFEASLEQQLRLLLTAYLCTYRRPA